MSSQHLFDIEIAKKYGLEVSIFLKCISLWLNYNYGNDMNFHEGRYWTYNTQDALTHHFPYWSRDQIKRIIKKSIDLKLLIKNKFNKHNYDQTSWFSLTDEGHKLLSVPIGRNRPMEKTKSPNAVGEIAQPIPSYKPYIKKHKREPAAALPSKKSVLKKTKCPENIHEVLTSEAQEIARKKNLDINNAFLSFSNYSKSKRWTSYDWKAAFLKWIVDERKNSAQKPLEDNRPKMRDYTMERLEREAKEAIEKTQQGQQAQQRVH